MVGWMDVDGNVIDVCCSILIDVYQAWSYDAQEHGRTSWSMDQYRSTLYWSLAMIDHRCSIISWSWSWGGLSNFPTGLRGATWCYIAFGPAKGGGDHVSCSVADIFWPGPEHNEGSLSTQSTNSVFLSLLSVSFFTFVTMERSLWWTLINTNSKMFMLD